MKKRILSVILSLVMLMSVLGGCSNSNKPDTGDRETVNFWYLWSGKEANVVEEIIEAYNNSQDKYEVVGLSTPDQQKIITGITGDNGPDITDAFDSNIYEYAKENIALCLDDFIAEDNTDLSVFVDASMKANQHDGKTYALPISANPLLLYYNKDLLKEAGYTKLPTTMEELFKMGEELTKVENGEITQLGTPLLAKGCWLKLLTYSAGYDFGTGDNITITNDGVKRALELVSEQVSVFGADALNSFVTYGNSMIYSEQDPFFTGEVAFRFDGPWFNKMSLDAGVNFGVTLIPSFADQNGKYYSFVDTSNFFIPSTADNAEGAWDFMKYITMGEGAKMFSTLTGNLPALKSLLEDSDVIKTFDSEGVLLKSLTDVELKEWFKGEDATKYTTALSNASDSVLLGESVDDIWKELQDVQNKK